TPHPGAPRPKVRELQDETGGFVTYIPLAFQPWEAPAMSLPETTGFDDLKTIAVSRLVRDNVPHTKSHWTTTGPPRGPGLRRPEDDRGLAADARQRAAHQVVLDHDRAPAGPGRPLLRRRR